MKALLLKTNKELCLTQHDTAQASQQGLPRVPVLLKMIIV
jgi:hypothetical protein